jgi:hypothetical protein
VFTERYELLMSAFGVLQITNTMSHTTAVCVFVQAHALDSSTSVKTKHWATEVQNIFISANNFKT